MPAPCAPAELAAVLDAGADERALQRSCVELGACLCECRGRAAGHRGRRARAADRRVARGAVGVSSRIRRDELDARRRDLGLDPAAEGEAVGGERRDRGPALVRPPPGRAERDVHLVAAGERRAQRSRGRARDPDHGNVESVVQAERARRNGAVDQDRGRARKHGGPRLVDRLSGTGEQRRPPGDEAVALVVEVACKRRSASAAGRVAAGPHDGERQRPPRCSGTGKGNLAVEQHVQARPHDDANRRGVVAEVCRRDGERVRRTAGPADAAVARACRAFVPRRGRRRACRAEPPPRSRGRAGRPGRTRTARSRRRLRPARRRGRPRRRRDRPRARSRPAAGRCGRRWRTLPPRSAASRRCGSAGSGTPGTTP